MTKGETELEMIPFVEGGELMMLWQKHRENLGEAVEITTSEPCLLSYRIRSLQSCAVLCAASTNQCAPLWAAAHTSKPVMSALLTLLHAQSLAQGAAPSMCLRSA